MSQRKYTHIREIEPQNIAVQEEGMRRRQITEELGLTWKQVNNWVADTKGKLHLPMGDALS